MAGLVAIPVVLGARLLAVGAPIRVRAGFLDFGPHTVKILTWAGLRRGISVALALSLRNLERQDAPPDDQEQLEVRS